MPQLESLEITCLSRDERADFAADDELSHLANLRNLRSLSLRLPAMTERALKDLPSDKLDDLTLGDCKVTEAGVLARFSHLKALDVRECPISRKVQDDLRRLLPHTAIGFPETR